MDIDPAIIRMRRRLGWQNVVLRLVCSGIGLLMLGVVLVYIGGPVLNWQWLIVTGGSGIALGIVLIIVALPLWFVTGLMIRSAVKDLPADPGDAEPIKAGERFGPMRVLVADDQSLHLALPLPALLAVAFRLLGFVVALCAGLGCILLFFLSGSYPVKALIFGAGLLGAAVGFASLPVAIQWVAGDLPDGDRGILIERVRWFVTRDAHQIREDQIESIFIGGSWLIINGQDGSKTPLVRTGGTSILDGWNKRRIVAALQRVIARPIQIEFGA